MSKSTIGRRRAGLATVATSALVMGACFAAAPAQADWSATSESAQIGLVDTSATAEDNQGATLLYPGTNGQKLGDVRMLIPNSFANGDTIDLAIYDRTATAGSNGQINADAAHKLGFGGVPTVAVDGTPYTAAGEVATDTDDPTNNTETKSLTPFPAGATKPSTAPAFTATLVQSSRANGLANDIIRLRVNGTQATPGSDPTALWQVTLSSITADLGAAVSPGELRVVPFAFNGAPNTTNSNGSPMFGNTPDNPSTDTVNEQVLKHYTVPAYVSPVTFNVGAPNNILADGTAQKIGDVTIAETNNYSLQNGTYTVSVDGADIVNDADSPVTVTKSGGGTTEAVTSPATVNPAADTVSFTLSGADNASKVTVKLSGLLLSDNTKGPISYTLSGGSVDQFLATAGQSPAIGAPPAGGVAPDSAFVPESGAEGAAYTSTSGVNQKDILAPSLTIDSQSTPLAFRIGGHDRYETASKIAQQNGCNDHVVLASGENFPDALSSNFLAQQYGASILLTRHNKIPASTLTALRQTGAQTVFVIGGTGAINEAVAKQLRETSQYVCGGTVTIGQGTMDVVRLGGHDRYDTNKVVNDYAVANSEFANPVGRTNPKFGESSKLTALMATGEDYADALAAGPATAGNGSGPLPLLLTRSGSLSPAAKAQLDNFGIEQVVIAGGTGAVSSGVESALTGMGIDVLRLAGANRYDTATKIADWEILPATATPKSNGGLGFDDGDEGDSKAYLATGENFADALAGGPLAGGNESPILLTRTSTLSPETASWLSGHAADYDTVIALGLGGAVSQAVLDAANAAVSAK